MLASTDDAVGSAAETQEVAREIEATESPKPASATEIQDVARDIKAVVVADTVKQNKEDCQQIGKRVDRVLAMLSWIEKSGTVKELAISSELEDLHKSLQLALKLVTDCQEEKTITCLCFAAGNLSKQLRQVNKNIMESIARFTNNVQNNSMFNSRKVQIGFHPNPPKDAEEETSRSGYSTDDIRSEVNYEEKYDPAGSEAARILSATGFERFSLRRLRKITHDFSEILGESSRATTYKGTLDDGRTVAIKVFTESQAEQLLEHYIRVYSVLGHHKNVLGFLGYCYEEGGVLRRDVDQFHKNIFVSVVEEFMPNASLPRHIGGTLWHQLKWNTRFRIIREIAHGVAYLHTKHVVHLDLKPENILLDTYMSPKICGLEISKILDQEDTETRTDEFVGTQYYMAPEYVRSGIVSLKNDVYSFGVLVLTSISGMTWSGVHQESIYWALLALDGNRRMELSDSSLLHESQLKEITRYMDIGLLCTQKEPEDRPTMLDILNMLDSKEILPAPKRNKDAGSEPVDPLPSDIRKFTFVELKEATKEFSDESLIAEGHVATVYKGELPGKHVVAIKRFRDPWGPRCIKQYMDVFSVHRQHKNIVTFLGYCDEVGREMVVEDYMPSRSLSEIMDGPNHADMKWSSRFRIALGVANAVNYLHTEGIIHFDLTPANIVIFDTHMNPKICDFALSKTLAQDEAERVTEEFEVTAGSTAPEYADGVVSVKNDVYSFGDLLCTITGISRSGPPQDLNELAMRVRVARRMKELFDPSLCDETQLKEIKRCMDIGLLCTQMERTKRPTIRDVLELLKRKEKLPNLKRNKVSSKKKNRA